MYGYSEKKSLAGIFEISAICQFAFSCFVLARLCQTKDSGCCVYGHFPVCRFCDFDSFMAVAGFGFCWYFLGFVAGSKLFVSFGTAYAASCSGRRNPLRLTVTV